MYWPKYVTCRSFSREIIRQHSSLGTNSRVFINATTFQPTLHNLQLPVRTVYKDCTTFQSVGHWLIARNSYAMSAEITANSNWWAGEVVLKNFLLPIASYRLHTIVPLQGVWSCWVSVCSVTVSCVLWYEFSTSLHPTHIGEALSHKINGKLSTPWPLHVSWGMKHKALVLGSIIENHARTHTHTLSHAQKQN